MRESIPPQGTVALISRADLAGFIETSSNAVVLLGTSPWTNLFLPIAHRLREQYGGLVAFGYLRLPELSDRAWALHLLRPALAASKRSRRGWHPGRLRAARRGYYLFIEGRAVGYHPGLYDPAYGPDLDRLDRCMAAGREDEAMLLLRRVAANLVDAVVGTFMPPLDLANPDAPGLSNPYRILGLSDKGKATPADIRTAFRRLLRENHPDLVAQRDPQSVPEAERRTQQIIQAYRALGGGSVP